MNHGESQTITLNKGNYSIHIRGNSENELDKLLSCAHMPGNMKERNFPPSFWEQPAEHKRARSLDSHSPRRVTSFNHIPMPSGWEMRLNEHGQQYFVDHNRKRTTWDDPRKDIYYAQQQEQSQNMHQNNYLVSQNKILPPGHADPLPNGWKQFYDQGKTVYLNEQTGQKTFVDPRLGGVRGGVEPIIPLQNTDPRLSGNLRPKNINQNRQRKGPLTPLTPTQNSSVHMRSQSVDGRGGGQYPPMTPYIQSVDHHKQNQLTSHMDMCTIESPPPTSTAGEMQPHFMNQAQFNHHQHSSSEPWVMPSHQLEDQTMELITSPYAEYNEHARGPSGTYSSNDRTTPQPSHTQMTLGHPRMTLGDHGNHGNPRMTLGDTGDDDRMLMDIGSDHSAGALADIFVAPGDRNEIDDMLNDQDNILEYFSTQL